MLNFHPLSLEDKPLLDAVNGREGSRSADFCFGNMFLWDEKFKQQVAVFQGYPLVLCCAYAHPIFPYPVGCGDPAPILAAMEDYARSQGFPLVIRGLERRHVEALEALEPGGFTFTEDRDYADYLYEAERLETLAGKKLHGKRNHIKHFMEEHDWRFERLTADHFPACRALLDHWAATAEDNGGSVAVEHRAIERAFAHYGALGLLGGALFAEGELVGFTIGEKLTADTFDVHFEKALSEINGAYPMVNREFVQLICSLDPHIRYVNREDDMGLENLRKSKSSYDPCVLLEKFTARRIQA